VPHAGVGRLAGLCLRTANYYDILIGENINLDAVWYYAKPTTAAKQIEGRCAFWRGVQIVE
jgi:uncharacterized protein (DUF427 family)